MKHFSERVCTTGYYRWLVDIINMHDLDNKYAFLLKRLYITPFTSKIDRDRNREEDSRNLRDEYFISTEAYTDGEVSVLEVLITIAKHCSDQSLDSQPTEEWFWEFMDNLDLLIFRDFDYHNRDGNREVDEIIQCFLKRCYEKNGRGGIFPLEEPDRNQQRVELWYQMSAYLQEKYEY